MDIWMGVFNTTTQSLNQYKNRTFIDPYQKQYLINQFNKLIGSIKLFLSVGQMIGFTDNYLVDSGLIRGLYKYSNDPRIRAVKDELHQTFMQAADKFLYVFDGRINKDDPESMAKERFNLTVTKKGVENTFLHSAAFRDEANWEGIESSEDLVAHYPEYDHIFRFLTEWIEQIPKENRICSLQNKSTFGLMLEEIYTNERENFQPSANALFSKYFQKYPRANQRTRTNLYKHIDQGCNKESAIATKRLFADKLYNRIGPWALKDRYCFEIWEDFWGDENTVRKVYQIKPTPRPSEQDPLSVQNLFEKGKMFNFLASRRVGTILRLGEKVTRNNLFDQPVASGKLARNILWDLYLSKQGDQINSGLSDEGVSAISDLASTASSAIGFGMVVPILKGIYTAREKIRFMYLSRHNAEYKGIISIIEKTLSNDL